MMRYIPEGCVIPTGYGIAWFDWRTRTAACLPVPLNTLAALLRSAWLHLKHFGGSDWLGQTLQKAEAVGYERGRAYVESAVTRAEARQWELFTALVVGTSAEADVRARLAQLRSLVDADRSDNA